MSVFFSKHNTERLKHIWDSMHDYPENIWNFIEENYNKYNKILPCPLNTHKDYICDVVYGFFATIDNYVFEKKYQQKITIKECVEESISYLKDERLFPLNAELEQWLTDFVQIMVGIFYEEINPFARHHDLHVLPRILYRSDFHIFFALLCNEKNDYVSSLKLYIKEILEKNYSFSETIESLINKSSHKRIIEIKTESVLVEDILARLEDVDEDDLNAIERFVSGLLVDAFGSIERRTKQIKELRQHIKICKQVKKQTRTIINIDNAGNVINNDGGTINNYG